MNNLQQFYDIFLFFKVLNFPGWDNFDSIVSLLAGLFVLCYDAMPITDYTQKG